MLGKLISLLGKGKSSATVGVVKPNPATKKIARSVSNWYLDRYSLYALQRNFLFVIAIFASISVLVALSFLRSMYEQRSISPYILEVDPTSSIVTVVDTESLQTYTAQEVVKESLLVQYIKAREAFDETKSADRDNLVRVMSVQQVYEQYKKDNSKSEEARHFGRGAISEAQIRGKIQYITPGRVQIRFTRVISIPGKSETKEKKYSVFVTFSFADSQKFTVDDRYLNPLGFQVNSYALQPDE